MFSYHSKKIMFNGYPNDYNGEHETQREHQVTRGLPSRSQTQTEQSALLTALLSEVKAHLFYAY